MLKHEPFFQKVIFSGGTQKSFWFQHVCRAETTLISFHIGDFLRGSEVAVEKITLRI